MYWVMLIVDLLKIVLVWVLDLAFFYMLVEVSDLVLVELLALVLELVSVETSGRNWCLPRCLTCCWP